MPKISELGAEWIVDEVEGLSTEIVHVTPSVFNEENRYLPQSVTSIPGPLRYAVNPFMREVVDCFDPANDVREVNLKKGVQITYTTVLESGLLFYMAHVKTLPIMFMTADKELASARIENNILPMLQQSGLGHIIRSSDEGNTRKTGKTAHHLQFEGNGYLVPFGAKNADKMRSYSIAIMLKDEIDAWPQTVGKDGDPDALSDDRCSGYWERRKIFRGSTPLIKGLSKIDKQYMRGDQRKYLVHCKACDFPQELRWETVNEETGMVGGFQWEMEDGVLVLESVCYCCQNCGEAHYEHDKEKLFSEDHGARWEPTAKPVERGIRSYHLPAMYSPIGMQPWYKCVSMYLQGFDPVARKVRDIGKYQVFYNNVLAESFSMPGSRVVFTQVSAHRRAVYRRGEIPNAYATEFSGSHVLFLTMSVDVHKTFLAVSITGWARGARAYQVDYFRLEPGDTEADDCTELSCSVWGKLRTLIEETKWEADDGRKYGVAITLIDSGYANDTVVKFCNDYAHWVYPIVGAERPSKSARIIEFAEFKTTAQTIGYRIIVDHYKDRIAPVLRREWLEETGTQPDFHYNAPVDMTDKELKELTVETRREEIDERGNAAYKWYRPGNARNELWDCLVYAHAAVEILAWKICIDHFELETIDWEAFWDFVEEKELYYSPPPPA